MIIPAAAAASGLDFRGASATGLSDGLARSAMGLLLRREGSGLRAGGDLDRRSNLEERGFGSEGSV